jgi:hypothetical protein
MTMTVIEHSGREARQAALMRGRQVANLAQPDPRFARLLDEHGCRWEIVTNYYGMGTILLSKAERHGDLVWHG